MPTPLSKTKLYIPPVRPGAVPRPHLVARLNEGLRAGHKLFLLSAPAGYGKTTLLAEWIGSREYGVGSRAEATNQPGSTFYSWLSLDPEDDELVRFMSALVLALQTVDETIGQDSMPLFEMPVPPPAGVLMGLLIDDLAAMTRPLVLVLDDYHVISDPRIHKAITLLLQRQPPHMHLAIATRADPPFPLSRLRGRGQLTEIRQHDLQFGEEEAAAFLAGSAALDLEATQVLALWRRTEGWAVGLQLAALVLQGTLAVSRRGEEGLDRLIAGLSGRHHLILDYLADEVLRQQPEPVQAFLLQTSILERMCGALCDALLGAEGEDVGLGPSPSQAMLEHLERANLFVVPLDGERQWYRYHRLFADLLQAQLGTTSLERVPLLHRRAAAWYGEHGFLPEAVRHALAVPDFELAADLMERAIQKAAAWSRLDGATFLRYWNELPPEVVRKRPLIQVLASRSLYVTGQRPLAEQVLHETEQWLHDHLQVPGAREMLGRIALDRLSYAALHGEVRRVIPFARQALAQVSEGDVYGRIRIASLLGLACLRAGEVAEAERAFSLAIAATWAAHAAFIAVPLLANLADVQMMQGRLHQARQTYEQGVEWGTVAGAAVPPAGYAWLGLARIQYEWDDLHTAQRHAAQALRLLRQGGMTLGLETVYATLSRIASALDSGPEAQVAMEQGMQIARGNDIPRLSTLMAAHQARLWLAQGRVDLAVQWAQAYRQVGETEYQREFEDLTLARVALAQGEPPAALAVLDPLLDAAEAGGRLGTAIEALALKALALSALGDAAGALAALGRALALAEPEGYVRTFLDEGTPMARLLGEAARRGISPHYAGRLLAAAGRETGGEPIVASAGAAPHPALAGESQALLEPLTGRELDVLRLLAQGLTNAEIGERLFISLPTVKSHTRSLYGKLGAHSRREAVALARGLGLL